MQPQEGDQQSQNQAGDHSRLDPSSRTFPSGQEDRDLLPLGLLSPAGGREGRGQ